MTSNCMLDKVEYNKLCLNLSRKTPGVKLKQLKFLLQDLILDIDINDERSFVELIASLEIKGELTGDKPGRNEGLLLCEMFDAVSMHGIANDICSKFSVNRGDYESVSYFAGLYVATLVEKFFSLHIVGPLEVSTIL